MIYLRMSCVERITELIVYDWGLRGAFSLSRRLRMLPNLNVFLLFFYSCDNYLYNFYYFYLFLVQVYWFWDGMFLSFLTSNEICHYFQSLSRSPFGWEKFVVDINCRSVSPFHFLSCLFINEQKSLSLYHWFRCFSRWTFNRIQKQQIV